MCHGHDLPTLTAVLPSPSKLRVPPALLATLTRLLLLDGRITILWGRWLTTTGDTVLNMLWGLTLRDPSGVAGGDMAVAMSVFALLCVLLGTSRDYWRFPGFDGVATVEHIENDARVDQLGRLHPSRTRCEGVRSREDA